MPTDAEWTILQNYLIANGYNWDGTKDSNKIAKSLAAKTDWYTNSNTGKISVDLTKNNSSGFSVLPGGSRYSDGSFNYKNSYGDWWSATEYSSGYAWQRSLYYGYAYLLRDTSTESDGFSVRLIRDN